MNLKKKSQIISQKYKTVYLFVVIFGFFSCNNNKIKNHQPLQTNALADSILTIEDVTKQIRKNPKNAELYVNRARLYILNNNIDDALTDLSIATKVDSLNPDHFIKLADLYLKTGQSGKSKKVLEKCVALNPNSAKAKYRLANLYFYVKDYIKSMEWLNKTQEVDANMPEIYFTKGLIYKETGDTSTAILNFQKAVENEPKYYDAYIMLGLLYADMKDTLAIAYYNNAITILPKSIEAYYNLAYFLQDVGYIQRAIITYNHILTNIDSTQSRVYFNLGYIQLQIKKNYSQAEPFFSKAIQYNPTYVAAYYNRGYCYEMLQKYSAAKKDYQQALGLNENYDLALIGLNRIDKNYSQK